MRLRAVGLNWVASVVIAGALAPASHADWEDPFAIDRFPTYAGKPAPQVAVGSAGEATVVWLVPEPPEEPSEGEPVRPQRWSVRTAMGSDLGLGAPAQISGDPAVTAGTAPRLRSDAAGRPTLLFQLITTEGDPRIVRAVEAAEGGLAGYASLSYPAAPSSAPTLAVGPRGEAIATWITSDGLTTRLQASFRPAGEQFLPPVTLTGPGASPSVVDAAISDGGRGAIVYNLESRYYVQRVAPNGHFGTRIRVRGDRPGSIEFDQANNLVGLFVSRRAAVKYGIMRPRRRRLGRPVTLALRGETLFLTRGAEPRSRLVAAWTRGNGTLQVSVADSDARLQEATPLFDPVPVSECPSTSTGATSPTVSASSNARGDAIVAWCGVNGIMASTVRAGGRFTQPVLVSRGERPLSVAAPAVAMDANGNALVVWGSADGVTGARFVAPAR